jgi:hypothetical protein
MEITTEDQLVLLSKKPILMLGGNLSRSVELGSSIKREKLLTHHIAIEKVQQSTCGISIMDKTRDGQSHTCLLVNHHRLTEVSANNMDSGQTNLSKLFQQ